MGRAYGHSLAIFLLLNFLESCINSGRNTCLWVLQVGRVALNYPQRRPKHTRPSWWYVGRTLPSCQVPEDTTVTQNSVFGIRNLQEPRELSQPNQQDWSGREDLNLRPPGPEAGSCANCPKRTGFNKLLFPDVRKDSCTSPDCFRAKIDACVKKTLETKPQLIQISAAWNSREGAPLGRNQYVELEIRKPKPNGASTKLSSVQKPCDKMTEAIVMDGGKRGQVVKVCADPSLPRPPSQHAFSAAGRTGAGGRTEAHRKGETGHHDSPSHLGHDPATRIGSVKEGRFAGGRTLPDRPSLLQPSSGFGEAAQGRGEERLCVRAGTSLQASRRV